MVDETRYIVVDNQRIAPISRVAGTNPTSTKKAHREDHPFGVVDRVTISREALEKYRHLQAQVEMAPTALLTPSRKLHSSPPLLLTDSPKKRS